MGWKYLQLTDAATGEATGGGELSSNPLFGMLTDKVGVRPGTHTYLRVDDEAVLQGQTVPFYTQLVDEKIASEIDQGAFNGAENFRKKTIGREDLVGLNPQM